MNKYLILILSIMVMTCSKPQNSAILEKMINKLGNDFPDIVSNPKKHRLQVLYTQIDRDKNNKPTFTTHGFRVREKEYFYPASTTKFPIAVLALEKANLNSKINPYMRLEVLTEKPDLSGVVKDLSSESGYPSIAHYLRTLFIISDNSANLPSGILLRVSLLNFLFFKNFLVIGVTTKVGQIVFTLMLYLARSIAIPFVRPSNPNLFML